jgi:hypothetical protein
MPTYKTITTYVVGVLIALIQYVLAQFGHTLPQDLQVPLSVFLTALVPHVWEMIEKRWNIKIDIQPVPQSK